MEKFQRDGEAPALIPMMEQENYPVKMGIDPDLGCTVSVPVVLCMYNYYIKCAVPSPSPLMCCALYKEVDDMNSRGWPVPLH